MARPVHANVDVMQALGDDGTVKRVDGAQAVPTDGRGTGWLAADAGHEVAQLTRAADAVAESEVRSLARGAGVDGLPGKAHAPGTSPC